MAKLFIIGSVSMQCTFLQTWYVAYAPIFAHTRMHGININDSYLNYETDNGRCSLNGTSYVVKYENTDVWDHLFFKCSMNFNDIRREDCIVVKVIFEFLWCVLNTITFLLPIQTCTCINQIQILHTWITLPRTVRKYKMGNQKPHNEGQKYKKGQ
jgi:hypothetical protein